MAVITYGVPTVQRKAISRMANTDDVEDCTCCSWRLPEVAAGRLGAALRHRGCQARRGLSLKTVDGEEHVRHWVCFLTMVNDDID